MTTICDHCASTIDRELDFESSVKCFMCAKVMHTKCAGLTKVFLKTLANQKNFVYICDPCNDAKDFRLELVSKLKTLEDCVTKKLNEQKDEISDLKKLVEQLIDKKCDNITNTARGLNVKRPYSEVLRDGAMNVNNVWQTPQTTGVGRWSDEMMSEKSNSRTPASHLITPTMSTNQNVTNLSRPHLPSVTQC